MNPAPLHVSLLLALLCAAVHADPTPPPTLEETHAAIEAKEYPQALVLISHALSLTGPAAAHVDRAAFHLLRADLALRQHDGSTALTAFDAAAKEPKATALVAAGARGWSQLLKKSPTLAYTPAADKTMPGSPAPAPISLVDPATRKTAIHAFFTEQLAALSDHEPDAKTTAPDDVEFLNRLAALADVEVADTDACAVTTKTFAPTLKIIGKSLTTILTADYKQLEKIKASAAKVQPKATQNMGLASPTTTHRGLQESEPEIVRALGTRADRITDAATAVGTLQKTAPIPALITSATKNRNLAYDILKANGY